MGLFGNGGFINNVTSTLNPFDDKNGAFKGSSPQVPITPATAGPDLSPQYQMQYGDPAMQSLQAQDTQYQNSLNTTAQDAGYAGEQSGAALSSTGQQSANAGNAAQGTANTLANGIQQSGSQYASDTQAGGTAYSSLLGQTANNASTYGLQQAGALNQAGQGISDYGQQQAAAAQASGAGISNYGQQQAGQINAAGQAISGAGSDIYSQAAGAQGRNINGSEQQQLESIDATQGPSAAQAQLQQATNANQAQSLAMARSGSGWGSSASSMNQAANNSVQAQQTAANQSAQLAAQENQAWRAQQSANLQAGGNMAAQQAQINDAQQNNLYQLGMSGMEAGANTQAQGANIGLSGMTSGANTQLQGSQLGVNAMTSGAGVQAQGAAVGQNAYNQQLSGQQAAANTFLGTMGQASSTDLGAREAAAGVQAQGYSQQLQGYGQLASAQQAGGQIQQQGYSNAGTQFANAGSYGLNNRNVQTGIVGQQYGLSQQAQQNALTAAGINNGVAIQQQNMGNQQMGALLGAAGSAIPMLATAAGSDRNMKEGIEPSNVTISADEKQNMMSGMDQAEKDNNAGTIVVPQPGTMTPLEHPTAGYDPFSQGTGISGPNQAQGQASSEAAQGASVAQTAQEPSASSTQLKKIAGGGNNPYGFGTGATPTSVFGNAMKIGAQNAMGNPSVNPVTGQSWMQNSGYHPFQMQQPSSQMLPMQSVTSDEREKEAMKTFDATPGYSYNYKDPDAMGATDGRQYGLMAQDLEKTPAGKSVVKQGPGGVKMVDTSRLALVEGAAMNGVLKRVAELEAKLGLKKGRAA